MATELKGARQMMSALKRIGETFPEIVESALFTEASIEMTEAKRRCPVARNGGQLRASGTVHEPVRAGKKISVTMSFGGPGIDYAIAVHEHLSEHSPPSWIAAEEGGFGVRWNAGGTGPKFLEGPLNESRQYMAQRISNRIQLDKHF